MLQFNRKRTDYKKWNNLIFKESHTPNNVSMNDVAEIDVEKEVWSKF